MASNKKTVPFYGTEEQKEQLLKVIQELRDGEGMSDADHAESAGDLRLHFRLRFRKSFLMN